ncbi:MAG: hypothetical protein ACM3MG_03505 [Bacillota bacterium]
MEKLILKFLTPLAILSLTACSSGTSSEISGIDSYTILAGSSFSNNTSDVLSGIGAVRFNNPLPGVLLNNSFALKAQLDGSINASVTVIFNSNDLNVGTGTGISIKLYRTGASVYASIGVNGNWVDVNSAITNMYAPLALDLIFDIHNNTGSSNKTRVLIWRRAYSPYAASTADVDTNSAGDLTSAYPGTQQAAGLYTGLHLDNATVTAAQVGTANILN